MTSASTGHAAGGVPLLRARVSLPRPLLPRAADVKLSLPLEGTMLSMNFTGSPPKSTSKRHTGILLLLEFLTSLDFTRQRRENIVLGASPPCELNDHVCDWGLSATGLISSMKVPFTAHPSGRQPNAARAAAKHSMKTAGRGL